MDLFDKRFVYLEWDDVLKGKEVYVADSLPELRSRVGKDDYLCHVEKNSGAYPFVVNEGITCYAFAYYDPNYFCKLAYAQGKQIQCGTKLLSDPWVDCIGEPNWSDIFMYRVKPEERKCNTCSYQCEPGMPCSTCRDGSNYKPRVVVHLHECSTCRYVDKSDSCEPCVSCIKYGNWEKPRKKRRKTNRELAKWVAQGNGECMCDDVAMSCWRYVYNEADMPVKDGIQIRGWDEAEWSEPIVEE